MSGRINPNAEFRPVYHPAGLDEELRIALEDLQAGRWVAMRDVLARTGERWGLRTSRSQVLAAVAAHSQVVRAWLVEEPANPDAGMMRARVETERVLHAWRSGRNDAIELAGQAQASALAAARRVPDDPVPWVCLLALAQADPEQRYREHRARPPEQMLPDGPWRLLLEVHQRDVFNREAHHRMLQALLTAKRGGPAAALAFTHWVRSWLPKESGSALLVLPLYAYAQHYLSKRLHGRYDPIARAQWTREPLTDDVQHALTGWFDVAHPDEERSSLDLNHLAHALWLGRRHEEAARVFAAIGRHATSQPWKLTGQNPDSPNSGTDEFLRARGQALAIAGPARAGPRRAHP